MIFNSRSKGSITVMLTLTLTIVISVIFTILEAARLTAVKTHYTDISYLCMDSLFGDYCYELFEEYGIFAINPIDVNPEAFLKEYIEDNISNNGLTNILIPNYNFLTGELKELNISDYTLLTDNDGEIFANQVMEYMKYKEVSEIISEVTDALSGDRVDVYDSSSTETDIDSFDLSVLDDTPQEDRRECLDISKNEAITYTDSMSDYIAHTIQNNLMLLLVEDLSKVSTTEVDKLTLPSMTSPISDEATVRNEGYVEDRETISPEKIIFAEYLSSIFNCYTTRHNSSLLSYELEYIINGSSKDDENLLNTAIKLIFMRASFNASYILSDSAKRTAARDLAVTVTGGAPIASKLAEFMIISSWSTAEGIIDTKDLLAGKKVPLIKDNTTWTLSLDNICNLSPGTLSANKGDKGFDYCFYLKLLISAQSELALRFRAMDLIQMDICLNYNTDFRISNCIYGIKCDFTYRTKNIFLNLNSLIRNEAFTNIEISGVYSYD